MALTGFSGALLFWGLQKLPLIERLEHLTFDWRCQLRQRWQMAPDDRLVFVSISSDSLQTIQKWPWNRRLHGEFLLAHSAFEPGVIAWDIRFIDPGTPAEDKALSDALAGCDFPNVLAALGSPAANASGSPLPKDLGPTRPITKVTGDLEKIPAQTDVEWPIDPFRQHAYLGFANSFLEADGVRRRIPLVVKTADRLLPSLSLQTFLLYWGIDPDDVAIRLGKSIDIPFNNKTLQIPINEKGDYWVNYRHEGKAFSALEYPNLVRRLVERIRSEEENAPEVDGKILMVGLNEESIDSGATPVQKLSPLAAIHLNVLDNFLKADFVRTIPFSWQFAGWFLLLALIQRWLRGSLTRIVALPLLLFTLYLGTALVLWVTHSLWLPLAAPAGLFLIFVVVLFYRRARLELKARNQMVRTFGSYLAPELLKSLLHDRNEVRLGGARKEVLILFSDLRGFTSLAEQMEEEKLVGHLNEYLTEMVKCIHAHEGTLHKFIGDAIMAAWGDILPRDPRSCCAAAVHAVWEMQEKLDLLNKEWVSQGKPALVMGIGLHQGPVVVGNIGSPQRMEFTLIGDSVNLASRLEGVTKMFGTRVLLSEAVRSCAPEEFLYRRVALLRVKGKNRPVMVYELFSKKQNPSDQGPFWLEGYDRGFDLFTKGDFLMARMEFMRCLEQGSEDGPTRWYLRRCNELIEHPPSLEWTGITDLTSK